MAALAASQATLRGIRRAGPSWAGTGRSFRSSWAIQASPDVPPKDAAAAETSTRSAPSGFRRPAAT